MQRLLYLGRVLLFVVYVFSSCKPLVREDNDSLPQGEGAVRAMFKLYLINKEYGKARLMAQKSLSRSNRSLVHGVDLSKISNTDEFLDSYVKQDMGDVNNIIASIMTSDRMQEVLSLLRKMPKELAELREAQKSRLQVAALIVYNNNLDLFRQATARWSTDSSQWLRQTEQKLTLAVSTLLAKSEFAQTNYVSKRDFDQAVVRINKALQKAKESLAAMQSGG